MQSQVINGIKKFLDTRRAGLVCLVIAIMNKSVIALIYSSLKADKSIYLLFAKSLLQNGKLAESVTAIENGMSYNFYEPAVRSPFYSLVAAPFLWLTDSFFWTQFILSIIGWIIFYTALYKIAFLVLGQRWITHAFILCSAFFLYPHELASTPKDTFAVGFSLWGIVLIHRLITKPNWTATLLLGVTICCLALVKLIYLPLAFMLFLPLIAFLFLKKRNTHLLHACLLTAVVGLIGFLFFHYLFLPVYHLKHSNIVSIPSDQTIFIKGFYPENLWLGYPFITSSFVNTQLIATLIEKVTSASFLSIIRLFLVVDVVLFFILIVAGVAFRNHLIQNQVLLALILASLLLISVTVFLSVWEQSFSPNSTSVTWTYVSDTRSFLIPMLTIQLVLFLFVFHYPRLVFLRNVLLLLFLLECMHGVYFTVKNIFTTEFAQEANVSNDALKKTVTLLKQEKGPHKTALVTTDIFLRRYAAVQDLPVFSFTNLNPDFSWMKKGDRFLIATPKEDSAYLNKFLAGSLKAVDTIPPFILHLYEVR